MKRNAYFQLIHKDSGVWLKIYNASDGGNSISADDIIQYLNLESINSYDIVGLTNYIKVGKFASEFLLGPDSGVPESEVVQARVDDSGLYAVIRFYPPAEGGKKLEKKDIVQEIKDKGIVHGINQKIVDILAIKRNYCTDYAIAKATMPRQGHDAKITYHFDTNVTAKPKRNDDGSVDFHKLGNIKPVKQGDILATLEPADRGEPGISVLGNPIPPKKVKIQRLRFGRNITLSEDHLTITSDVAGHVTLVDSLVMVSDVYSVRNNVDASTGDIEYKGTVEVTGNILTGYKVCAEGDIIVNGVVEGAILEAGGNIVLKSGMQGMSRGVFKAKGNVAARYLENCTVEVEGELTSDAVMHSQITARGDVTVTGKRGLVTGGYIKTYGNIRVGNVGSTMGTDTKLEILSDTDIQIRAKELQDQMSAKIEEVKKMDQVIMMLGKVLRQGGLLTEEQENYLKVAKLNRGKLMEDMESVSNKLALLNEQIVQARDVSIRVESRVYAGTKIVIRDMMKIIRETITQTEFVLEGADIKEQVITF